MSLRALIEAVEYVDKGEMSSEESNAANLSNTGLPASVNKRKLSGDGTIKHWRKIAVAQSVMELKKTHVDGSRSNGDAFQDSVVDGKTNGICNNLTSDDHHSLDLNNQKNRLERHDSHKSLEDVTDSELAHNNVSPKNNTHHHESVHYNSQYNSAAMNGDDAVSSSSVPRDTRNFVAPGHRGTGINADQVMQPSRLPQEFETALSQRNGTQSGIGDASWQNSSVSLPSDISKRRIGSVTREAHNLLEKSRRKHLSQCFERLRNNMSLSSKCSHLKILNEALRAIKNLNDRSQSLEQMRLRLSNQKKIKQGRLEQLKRQVSKHKKPDEINNLIMKACQEAFETEGDDEPIDGTDVKHNSVGVQEVSCFGKGNHYQEMTTKNWTNHNQNYSSMNGMVPASKLFPPLSSTMNLVLQNVNEARRICTMIPNMHIMTSPRGTPMAKLNHATMNHGHSIRYQVPCQVQPPHFTPSAIPAAHINGRSYTVPYGGNFMQSNPLKIVVKAVDSAKQQARVSKPMTLHGPIRSEMPHKPRESQRILAAQVPSLTDSSTAEDSQFVKSSCLSDGASFLATPSSNLDDKSSKESFEDANMALPNGKRPRSKSDIEDLNEDIELNQKRKRKSSSSNESFPSKHRSRRSARLHRNSFPSPRSLLKSPQPLPVSELSDSPQSKPIPAVSYTPSPIAISSLVNPSKSITQVCFSTLNMTKPGIPSTFQKDSQHTEKSQENQETAKSSVLPSTTNSLKSEPPAINSPPVTLPAAPNVYPIVNVSPSMIPMSMTQNMVPMMMPVMASPSMGIMMQAKSVQIFTTASTKPSISASTQTTPTLGNQSLDDLKTNEPRQMMAVKAFPQFPCMMPMGFPSMMAGPNGATMVMQAPMGGFFPMMAQGQNWGFVMPQGMMMATPNDKNNTMPQPVVESKRENLDDKESKNLECNASDCAVETITTVTTTTIDKQSPPSPSNSSANNGKLMTTTNMAPMQQPFQMFQNAGQFMMPVPTPTGQNGGFFFGGAPTMMPAQGQPMGYQMPMNMIGYPMQFGGSNAFQFAMPNMAMSAPRPQESVQGNTQPCVVSMGT